MNATLQLAIPILGALAAGGAIGFEREYRSRPAGLRTHMLVALASALLMLGAVHQIHWLEGASDAVVRIDPVRMAHGILTGVGFLCGGVIFQQGVSVHGLTTAAALWITSAIGTLFGVGLYELAIGGTVLTLIVLSGARWLDRHMPQKNFAEITVRSRREAVIDEAELRRMLRGFDLEGARVCQTLADGGAVFALSGPFSGQGVLRLDELSAALRADPRVLEFVIHPRKD
jgi:putative Mg2+ transporter-C (MgtC) family protein